VLVATDGMREPIVRGATDNICVTVVEALARATGTDALELDPPLSGVVDTDALNQLFRSNPPTSVTFEYQDHEIVVGPDEAVTVDGTTVEVSDR